MDVGSIIVFIGTWFINGLKMLSNLVINFGEPFANFLHGIHPIFPADGMVGSGILIILAGGITYKFIESKGGIAKALLLIVVGGLITLVLIGRIETSTILDSAVNLTSGE